MAVSVNGAPKSTARINPCQCQALPPAGKPRPREPERKPGLIRCSGTGVWERVDSPVRLAWAFHEAYVEPDGITHTIAWDADADRWRLFDECDERWIDLSPKRLRAMLARHVTREFSRDAYVHRTIAKPFTVALVDAVELVLTSIMLEIDPSELKGGGA